jgi:hypothetical protein
MYVPLLTLRPHSSFTKIQSVIYDTVGLTFFMKCKKTCIIEHYCQEFTKHVLRNLGNDKCSKRKKKSCPCRRHAGELMYSSSHS